jgi:hypothetical protein
MLERTIAFHENRGDLTRTVWLALIAVALSGSLVGGIGISGSAMAYAGFEAAPAMLPFLYLCRRAFVVDRGARIRLAYAIAATAVICTAVLL